MIAHKFVTSGSTLNNLVYRTVFTNEAELEVPLPQPCLFSIHSGTLSYSREDLSAQMVVPLHPAQPTSSPPGASDAPYYGAAYDASEWRPWE